MKRMAVAVVIVAAVVLAPCTARGVQRGNGGECQLIAPDADHVTAVTAMVDADYSDGRWTFDGRTVGFSSHEDARVYSSAQCAADLPAYGNP